MLEFCHVENTKVRIKIKPLLWLSLMSLVADCYDKAVKAVSSILHVMSSLTDVETGSDTLLFEAWQVKIECRSDLWMFGMTSWLVTLYWVEVVKVSSTRWWSLHQVTLGLGLPPRTWQIHILWGVLAIFPGTNLAGDGESIAHFVGAELQSDLLVVLVLDLRLLWGNNHVQQNVAHPGGSSSEVHPAFVRPLVQRADVVQHQSAGVVVSPEEGSALENTVVRPVASTQITFPYRGRGEDWWQF